MTIMHRGFSYAVDDLSSPAPAPTRWLHPRLPDPPSSSCAPAPCWPSSTVCSASLTDNVVSLCSAPALDANYLIAQSFAVARAALGERGGDITAVAMHSSVYYYLVQVGALTFSSSPWLTAATSNGWRRHQPPPTTTSPTSWAPASSWTTCDSLNEGTSSEYPCFPVYCFGGGVVNEGVRKNCAPKSTATSEPAGRDVPGLSLRHARPGHHLDLSQRQPCLPAPARLPRPPTTGIWPTRPPDGHRPEGSQTFDRCNPLL